MTRKFNTYFYVKVMRMVFSVVESAGAQLQVAQLNFYKVQNIISCAKAFIASAKDDARFDVAWSRILSATEANDGVVKTMKSSPTP